MIKRTRKPTHPGEVFLLDVLEPLNVSITEAARRLGVSRKHLSNVCNGSVRLSPELAARIAIATDTSIQSWLGMQTALDVWEMEQSQHPPVSKIKAA
jgi:addiction module HigA family antidote